MAAIKLYIKVGEIENVLTLFNCIKVYRSDNGIDGTYSEITDANSRIRLELGVTTYLFDDATGLSNSWYKTSYYHTDTALESSLSDPRQGETFEIDSLILSVQELKDIYLYGLDLTDDSGNEFPDIMFEWSIKFAIDWLEKELDIKIKPTLIVEYKDYYRQDYNSWCFLRLEQMPVISVEKVSVIWPSGQTVIEFDSTWIKLRKEFGQINIVPTAGTFSQFLLTAGGSFLPLLSSGRDFIPDLFKVEYTAGFENGQVDMSLRELIGKKASLGPLNVAGDLLGGAGIASQSIGIDGLSQSFNTTSSATNAGYGARILAYEREVKEQLPTLKRYYKGIKMTVV